MFAGFTGRSHVFDFNGILISLEQRGSDMFEITRFPGNAFGDETFTNMAVHTFYPGVR